MNSTVLPTPEKFDQLLSDLLNDPETLESVKFQVGYHTRNYRALRNRPVIEHPAILKSRYRSLESEIKKSWKWVVKFF